MTDRLAQLAADPSNFTPANEEELKAAMANPMWRLNNLYFITTKEEEDEGEGLVVRFRMNAAQRRLAEKFAYGFADMWHHLHE